MKNLVIGIVVLVLVGAGFYYLSRSNDEAPVVENDSVIAEENAVVFVPEQEDEELVVRYAKLAEPGYIIIFLGEGDEKEVAAQSELLAAGEHRNVKTTKRGGSRAYTAAEASVSVVADNGDEVFDVATDTEVLVAEEDVVLFEGDVVADGVSEEVLEELLEEAGFTVLEDEASEEEEMVEDESSDSDSEESTEGEENGGSEVGVDVEVEADTEEEATN